MPAEFVHLHVHSQYSFLTSAVKLGVLPERVKRLGMRAVAVTDHGSMFGSLRHDHACRAAGVSPILGAELNVLRPGSGLAHLVLLATNRAGYENLVGLVSRGHLEPVSEGTPSVSFEAGEAEPWARAERLPGGWFRSACSSSGRFTRAQFPSFAMRLLGHVSSSLTTAFPANVAKTKCSWKAAKDLSSRWSRRTTHSSTRTTGLRRCTDCVRSGGATDASPFHHGSSEITNT
jgi:hypothetical protein